MTPQETAPCICGDHDCRLWLEHGQDHSTPGDAEVREALAALLAQVDHAAMTDGWADYGEREAARALLATPSGRAQGEVEPVAYRYVHLDYAGRKVSRYGTHPERVNGHDPVEVHPLYAAPPAQDQTKGVGHG